MRSAFDVFARSLDAVHDRVREETRFFVRVEVLETGPDTRGVSGGAWASAIQELSPNA